MIKLLYLQQAIFCPDIQNLRGNMHQIKKDFARNLRRESTPEEKIVWEALRNRKFMGLKFRRQHVLQGFVVDFYCHSVNLAIEIDGKIHERQLDYDLIRQNLIEEKATTFIRVTNYDVNHNIEKLYNEIKNFVNMRKHQSIG